MNNQPIDYSSLPDSYFEKYKSKERYDLCIHGRDATHGRVLTDEERMLRHHARGFDHPPLEATRLSLELLGLLTLMKHYGSFGGVSSLRVIRHVVKQDTPRWNDEDIGIMLSQLAFWGFVDIWASNKPLGEPLW